MGKLDKKVIKFITAHPEMDLDAGDLAIELHCDEDAVQEALDSLKDQGKVESVVRDNKTVWQLSMQEFPEEPDEPAHFSERSQTDAETVSFDLTSLKPPVMQAPKPASMPEKPASSPPPAPVSWNDAADIDDDDGDMDVASPFPRVTSPVMGIIIAVVISVALSAIVALLVGEGSKKSFSDGLLSLERTSTEANAKIEKRVDDLSAQVKSLADKAGGAQQPAHAPAIHAMKPAVKSGPQMASKPTARPSRQAVKAQHSPKKKKMKSSLSSTDESAAPESSDKAASSEPSSTEPSPSPSASPSDQSAPPPSSGTEENATPAPSTPPEGSGQ